MQTNSDDIKRYRESTTRKIMSDKESDRFYDDYMTAMKRQHRHSVSGSMVQIQSPRERYRKREAQNREMYCPPHNKFHKIRPYAVRQPQGPYILIDRFGCGWNTLKEAGRIGILASMVPDEIIYRHSDHSIRSYDAALMLIDISGFTDLSEKYTKSAHGGPSTLTQVLNSYIGAMVQEILTHNGDVLKFSGDAFLSMWRKTARLSMQELVHTAIDCGLIIQKNYGSYVTDVGARLLVKVAITAGRCYFSIIGEEKTHLYFVLVGQPVWDVKLAEHRCSPGDVLIAASAWMYVNEADYCTQPGGDGRHTKVLGVGASWKRVERFQTNLGPVRDIVEAPSYSHAPNYGGKAEINCREFSLRPAVIAAMRGSWWPGLRRFMLTPVLRAVDNDEPMEFLTEVRRVVVLFVNIVTSTVPEDVLIGVIDKAYKCALSVTSESGGLVNKVSLFDKDMMFLVVFGLRGLKHEDETQKALLCASHLKENLTDPNILSISIGVTSGITYCGIVGHTLRREYTVIGPAVNKAARLMMAYPNIVTCDKETFLRSKLNQEYFMLMEPKVLKGIAKPGPIYEFNKKGWAERLSRWRHPILGRNEELRKFKMTLQNAIDEHKRNFTRYRDHKYAVAFMGPKFVGKKRLVEECLDIIPNYMRAEKIVMTEVNTKPFTLVRMIFNRNFSKDTTRYFRDSLEDKIRYSVDITSATAIQIYAINKIFGCGFPLPERFHSPGNFLGDISVKALVQEIYKKNFLELWVLAIIEAQYIDDGSWRILLVIMDAKLIFIVFSITDTSVMSLEAQRCLDNNMIVKVPLAGIGRTYHAALACQLLDVEAIPTDLEKVIESASNGRPGWIQDFVISLVQRGALTIVTVPRIDAIKEGAVMPLPGLLEKMHDDYQLQEEPPQKAHSIQSNYGMMSVSMISRHNSRHNYTDNEGDIIQMAVLADSYTFDDIKVDMTMDALILKTYDSLTPFEKMLLKCGSVLGDIFSRRMLLHLLQCDCPRKVAEAVAKLFTIRVLECEGGDFTKNTSLVLVHTAPARPRPKSPHCACLGIKTPAKCEDLPTYAFCGYMKFRHSLFRTTTYELLTENQKHDMHGRALSYLERYTRRCSSCDFGCFIQFLGLRCDDGLVPEREDLKRTRMQIRALSAEIQTPGDPDNYFSYIHEGISNLNSFSQVENEGELIDHIIEGANPRPSKALYRKHKRIRSFSSLTVERCECQSILQSVYCQCIGHCQGAGEFEKLYDAYLEYANFCINVTDNIPQAVRLLSEAEELIKNDKFGPKNLGKSWIKDFYLARVYSTRGMCLTVTRDLREARHQLLEAMKLYCDPFPSSKHWVKVRDCRTSFHQMMALYVVPNLYICTDSGFIGRCFEDIAKTLSRLYKLFMECKEDANAALAAKLGLNYALRSNSCLRLMCVCYGHMISVYRQKRKFSICHKLEKRAMELCRRKRGQLDITEVKSVCYLYTNIFLFYVEYGKKIESLEFGLSVMQLMATVTDISTRQDLVLWTLKLLISDLKIHEMVTIMREFLYMTNYYDLSSETWYYYYALVIVLDTGYCVECYGACDKFYMKKGDALLRSGAPAAARNFFVCMWLITIRIGAWERSILWEEKIRHIITIKFDNHEFSMMLVCRLVEGLLITLVKEMDNRNIKKIIILEKALKTMFQNMYETCDHAPMYRSRYYLLLAYYNYIRGRKYRAYNYLNKARDLSKHYVYAVMIWADHTRNHWKGTLNPKWIDYWAEHIEPDNLLDYRDFDPEKSKIVPYTLPLPRDLEK